MSRDTRYLYFYTKNYTGMYTTTGYTLPCTPFTFIPVFDNGTDLDTSNTRIMWDFGDGTTSSELTAVHYFAVPGTYNVLCYSYGNSGMGHESSFVQNIFVKDFISDTLILSSSPANVTEVSHMQNPFKIIRFNSWQTFDSLSSVGCTVMLYASGSGAPLLDTTEYARDKYAHLKPSCRFMTYEYNFNTSGYDLVPVNSVNTVNNAIIYVKYDESTQQLLLCGPSDAGATLAGTSGERVVFFTDDVVKGKEEGNTTPSPVTVLAYFDSSQLIDNDSYDNTITNENRFPVLKQVLSEVYTPIFIDQVNIDHLSITSNGNDGEGFVSNSFNIQPHKFVNQKIPFVVRVKDAENYSSRSSSILHLMPQTSALTANTLKVYLLDEFDNNITDGINFVEDFGVLSSVEIGGFFRGYLTSSKPYNRVHLSAVAQLSGDDYDIIPSVFGVASFPQSRFIYKFDIINQSDNVISTFVNTLIDTATLTGVYAAGVIPERNMTTGAVQYGLWVADADQDLLMKYSTNGVLLLSANLPVGSSPSNFIADSNNDIWVSLFDSVSVVKMNSQSGVITRSAVPTLPNRDWTSPELYLPLSGHAGQNSILPTCVDVDISDKLWVTYSNPLSSFICRYDTLGTQTLFVDVTGNYFPSEVVVTPNKNAWVICKDASPLTNTLSSKDRLMLLEYVSESVDPITTIYDLSASLWNISYDNHQNIWITANRNDVIFFDAVNRTSTKFTITASDVVVDESNFTGIACTTKSSMVVLDGSSNKLRVFNIDNFYDTLSTFDLSVPSDLNNAKQIQLNAVGDWTGYRHISKFFHHFGLKDNLRPLSSSEFNIEPAKGNYQIGKKNENFDAKAQYRSYLFGESYVDDTRLMDDFIGTAVGSSQDSPNSLGKKIYEKISNFVDNTANIDTCNVAALKSIHHMVNDEFWTLNSYNFNSPANVSRLVDLMSIKYSKLRGDFNKFAENFDSKGTLSNTDMINIQTTTSFGKNIGSQVDVYTTVLSSGVDGRLVAYEKFSGQYHLINTKIAVLSSNTYNISGYQPSWGWGLVLPQVYLPTDIVKYYSFFNYVSSFDGRQIEGVINWEDTNTVVPNISSANQWNEIVNGMFVQALAEGLEVIPK